MEADVRLFMRIPFFFTTGGYVCHIFWTHKKKQLLQESFSSCCCSSCFWIPVLWRMNSIIIVPVPTARSAKCWLFANRRCIRSAEGKSACKAWRCLSLQRKFFWWQSFLIWSMPLRFCSRWDSIIKKSILTQDWGKLEESQKEAG